MWYFTWILGVLFACCCGIINVMWLEYHHYLEEDPNMKNQDGKKGV